MLHRLDSSFHMNLTRTPTETNAENLRKEYPHLEVKSGALSKQQKGKAVDKAGPSKATPAIKTGNNTPKAKAGNKPEKKKTVALTLPDPSAASAGPTAPSPSRQQGGRKTEPSEPEKKSKQRAASPVESEEEDDVLTVEYPGGNPAYYQPPMNFESASTVSVTRRWSEFAREIRGETDDEEMTDAGDARAAGEYRNRSEEEGYEEEEEEDDEEEEEEEESPGNPAHPDNNQAMANSVPVDEPDRYTFDAGSDEEEEDFGDLEAEMLKEFDKVESEENGADGNESEVSEEE